MGFVWKKVDGKLKKEVKRKAKEILDDFSRALKDIEDKKLLSAVERDKQIREETKVYCDKEFRNLFFKNVPEKEGDFVLAEKKKW